jgi:hypothetical protein
VLWQDGHAHILLNLLNFMTTYSPQCSPGWLGSQVGYVYVGAGVNQIPTGVVWVFVHNKIISAIPTPIRADKPIPRSYFKIEAARQPKSVVVAVHSNYLVSVVRSEMFEMTVLERMIDFVAFVVGRIMSVPVIVRDVLRTVHPPILPVLFFDLCAAGSGGRRWWNSASVRSRGIPSMHFRAVLALPVRRLIGVLRANPKGHAWNSCQHQPETLRHVLLPSMTRFPDLGAKFYIAEPSLCFFWKIWISAFLPICKLQKTSRILPP